MAAQVAKIALVVFAVAFAFVAAYCLLWFFASSDLAFVSCNGHFSLSAPTFRCKQPPIALILTVVFVALSVSALLWSRRLSRGRASAEESDGVA